VVISLIPLCGFSIFSMEMLDNTPAGTSHDSPGVDSLDTRVGLAGPEQATLKPVYSAGR
jgi:hypothetical protein